MAQCTRLAAPCGAEVTGIDATAPLAPEVAQQLRDWLLQHGLLIVRGQNLSKQQQVEFSRVFGKLAIHPLAHQVDPEAPELLVLDSHGKSGDMTPENPEEISAAIDWHTDLAYVTKPNYAGLLHGKILPPEDGLTGFIDRHATYDSLPAELKARIAGLTVVQSWRHSQESISRNPAFRTDEGAKVLDLDLFPDLGFPLALEHPISGRTILNVSNMWSSEVIEMPGDEGKSLLKQLLEHSTHEKFIYWHSYCAGDVVIWDNYRMLHAASGTKGKYRRQLYRTTIEGEAELGSLPIDSEAVAAAEQRIAALRKEKVGL